MVAITLENITKKFGKVIAVNDVSFKIKDGEFWVLLGPSGSGKTTLLYLISGIYKPTAGRIYFDNQDVTELSPTERNVGLVFQNYALYPHMTVFDNIAFPLKIKRRPQQEINQKVREVAKLLHIENLLDRYPSQLSGGQQQRVALARALVKEPSVLLLDEPLSNLDALLRIYIRAELKRLQNDLGITAVYVTHDQSEALAIADKVVVINHGVVQQISNPHEIYENPRNMFVATFIGNPPSNTIEAQVVDGGELLLPWGKVILSEERMGVIKKAGVKHVIIAFRPEHISIWAEEPTEKHGLFLKGEIYATEPLGRETLVTISFSEDVSVKAVMFGDIEFSVGDSVYLHVPEKRLRFFDPKSGLNLELKEN